MLSPCMHKCMHIHTQRSPHESLLYRPWLADIKQRWWLCGQRWRASTEMWCKRHTCNRWADMSI